MVILGYSINMIIIQIIYILIYKYNVFTNLFLLSMGKEHWARFIEIFQSELSGYLSIINYSTYPLSTRNKY